MVIRKKTTNRLSQATGNVIDTGTGFRPHLTAQRRKERFSQDSTRVITRFFVPGSEERARKVVQRVLTLTEPESKRCLERIIEDFSTRHKNIWKVFARHFEEVKRFIPKGVQVNDDQRHLIGAYFTHEYSVQAAAFLNPSIVPHPDQSYVPEGALRFILSFRSIGEGHISSIEFRSGIIDKDKHIIFDGTSHYVETPQVIRDPGYDKNLFSLKLEDMGVNNEISEEVLDELGEWFSFSELEKVIRDKYENKVFSQFYDRETTDNILWLARSNYELKFDQHRQLGERVIFPTSESESQGIEDARFVRFVDDNGEVTYYATYTAYNGFVILPQVLKTDDFYSFKINTLNGEYARDKGMALFPRKIDEKYAMLSRIDGENLYISYSDNVHFWHKAEILKEPERPWEFIQIGNCGSPLETEAGWLVLTHGVGPMRRYCIGAILLDLEDPSKVIGHLKDPLLAPTEEEREGYVPNVLYSCGSLIHNGELIIPYAMSDTASGIATVAVTELLNALTWS